MKHKTKNTNVWKYKTIHFLGVMYPGMFEKLVPINYIVIVSKQTEKNEWRTGLEVQSS